MCEKFVFISILQILYSGNTMALGPSGHENLPALVAILAEAIRREAINVTEIDDDELLELSSPPSPLIPPVHPERAVRLASVARQSALGFRVIGIFTHIQQVASRSSNLDFYI